MNLSWVDYAIVLVYVGGTITAGILARGAIKGISDFLVAGRTLKTHMAVATMVSTGLGLVTVMYFAEEGFTNGFAPFLVGVFSTVVHIIIGKTGFIVSRLRHLRVMTVPEFYEIKYNRGVRLFGGSILALAGVLNMGLFPILGSKFVIGFTGIPVDYVRPVMIGMLIVVVFYTLMGGMVSVVLTDFAQFILLSLGFFVATYIILTHPDLGWTNIVAAVERHRGEAGFNTFANPDFGWIWVFYFLSVLSIGIVWQPEMSRPLSTQNSRVARRVFWISGITGMGRAIIPMFFGAAALAYFNDPDFGSQLAMPTMLGSILPIGIAGLFLAGMFAAFMSTHDSYLLAWSGVIVRDIISPLKAMRRGSAQQVQEDGTWGGLTSQEEIYWTRALVVLLAAFLAVFGIYYIDKMPETAFKFMYVTGTIFFAGCVGTVGLGLYWRKANAVGACSALLLGAFLPLAFLILNLVPRYTPAFLRYFVENSNRANLASMLLAGLAMIVGSLLTQRTHPPRELDFSDME